MAEVFFLTALVLTTRTPDLGWIQYTQSYADKKICEEVIQRDYEKIIDALQYHVGKSFKLVQEMRCMTYDQAVKMNSKLGHN
tara:strand:- start:94 stop:339 length:246 start_codon:yes stop_codon:yes gene_type:complete